MKCKGLLSLLSLFLASAFAAPIVVSSEMKEGILRGLRYSLAVQEYEWNLLAERPREALLSSMSLEAFVPEPNVLENVKMSVDARVQYIKGLEGYELAREAEERMAENEKVKEALIGIIDAVERDSYDPNRMWTLAQFEQQRIWDYELTASVIQAAQIKFIMASQLIKENPFEFKARINRLYLDLDLKSVTDCLGIPPIPELTITNARKGSSVHVNELRDLFLERMNALYEPLAKAQAQTLPIPALRSILRLAEPFRSSWNRWRLDLDCTSWKEAAAVRNALRPLRAGSQSRIIKVLGECERKLREMISALQHAPDHELVEVMNRLQPYRIVNAFSDSPLEIFLAKGMRRRAQTLLLAKHARTAVLPLVQELANDCRKDAERMESSEVHLTTFSHIEPYIKMWQVFHPEDPVSFAQIFDI